MKIEILKIDGRKDFDKEVVWMHVKDNCDAGRYTLADSTFNNDGTASNKIRHTFWLPDKEVKKGDYIKVFTKSGKYHSYENGDKTTTHVFYWCLGNAVWNNDKDCAILFEHKSWQFKEME